MSDLDDRLAEALREHMTCCPMPMKHKEALAEYDNAHRKPDAAERAGDVLAKNKLLSASGDPVCIDKAVKLIRHEVALDNAERDARDREREEAVRRLLGMYTVCTTPGCQCASGSIVIGVRRAFGWDKEGT